MNYQKNSENQISALNEKKISYVQLDFPLSIAFCNFNEGKIKMSPIWPKPVHLSPDHKTTCATFHYHAHYEFIYVLKGTFTQHLENSKYCLNAGDATLLNSKIRHYEGAETDSKCIYINISPNFLHNLFDKNPVDPKHSQHKSSHILKLCNKTSKHSDNQIRASLDFHRIFQGNTLPDIQTTNNPKNIIKEIINTLSNGNWGYIFTVQGLLLKLFSSLENQQNFHITHVHTDSSTETVLFDNIEHYVKKLNGRISRKELSNFLHYNPDYLGRIVKHQSGMSFLRYCQSIWLKKAKKLLRTTNMNVSEIIDFLGFKSKNNFYRVFSASTGMTPTEYRKKYNFKQ